MAISMNGKLTITGGVHAKLAGLPEPTSANLQFTLANPDPTASDLFGNSVAISGNYAVVGAFGEDIGATDAGSAYVFNTTTGVLVSTLVNPNPSVGDNFGNSVAISGNYAVVGAYAEDIGATDGGSAYVFDIITGALVSTLANPNPSNYDNFGFSVAISGNYAVVSAYTEGIVGATNVGQAYIFNITTGVLVSTLNNPNPSADNYFGWSVAISGNYAVVGAPYKNASGVLYVGQAYIFNITTGALVSTLVNPNPSAGDNFGNSVAISGNYAVVGAYAEDIGATDNVGSAYIFNITTGALVSTLANPNPSAYDAFGNSVAISGNYAVVGASYKDIGATNAGSAYIFNITTGALVLTLANPNPSNYDYFGYSVAISGNYVVVSALYKDIGADDAGSAYIYKLV